MANLRKQGITLLKIIVSVALIYFIFSKLNTVEILKVFKKANLSYLFIALLLLAASKVIAAFRLNLYFHELNVFLTIKSNLKLYVLGMFYNLFLPGGIGGDAYKGYIIKKQFNTATKKLVSILFLDRLSGLLLIGIYTCILALFLQNEALNSFKIAFAIAIPLGIAFYWFLNYYYFKSMLPIVWKTAAYAAFVQLTQLISVYFILKALDIELHTIAYLFIFMISSIVSVIPLTIGGIGSREVTFMYGATLLDLDENTSVAISLLFFMLSALVSFVGIVYHFKKPELEVYKTL